jgi:hypothetical protein
MDTGPSSWLPPWLPSVCGGGWQPYSSLGAGQTFGATWVAQETNRRFHNALKKPVDVRTVSTVLRRLRDTGELRQVQPGGPAHEAVYAKAGEG